MKYIALENELKKHIRKRRMVEIVLCVVSLVIAITFSIAYEQSKVVETIGFGPFQYQSITYNTNFVWGIMVGVLSFIPSIIALICDVIFIKYTTIEVNGYYVTVYRGMVHNNLYVDGVYRDGVFLVGHYLETSLPDGTKVFVSLEKWSAHFSFSNGQPSIEVRCWEKGSAG